MKQRSGLGSLLLAGVAAYGIYRLSKMSADQRNDLVTKGKRLLSDNLRGMKNMFGGNGKPYNSPYDAYSGHDF